MIILNTFNWRLPNITDEVKHFNEIVIDAIQNSPICKCKEIDENNIDEEWWKLYQNVSFDIGNRLGTKDDLYNLATELHKYNMKLFQDVILRHVAGRDNGECVPHENVDSRLIKFVLNNNHLKNPHDRYHIINGCWDLPMLDYNNKELQEQFYIPFLDELFDLGVDGLRIDEAKHISLRSEGGTFWDMMDRYKDKFIYGECINCPTNILNDYTNHCKVLTDRYAKMNQGSVRFFESHDTYNHTWGKTKELTKDQRIDLFRDLCTKYHNVMVFLRPFDDIYEDIRFIDICRNKYYLANQN